MKNKIVAPFFLGSFIILPSTLTHSAEVYQCFKNGVTTFQSTPCSGHIGKTSADLIKEENEARKKRLAEIQQNEEKRQERMQHTREPQSGFKKFLSNIKSFIQILFEKVKSFFGLNEEAI